MAERGVALAILGIVSVIALVGLILLFQGGSGEVVLPGAKLYPGKVVKGETGQGFQYAGEGAYVSEQKGDCLSNEFWIQGPRSSAISLDCRPGQLRVEIYQRNRKFFGAPDQTYAVDGFCCLQPNVRAEARYE